MLLRDLSFCTHADSVQPFTQLIPLCETTYTIAVVEAVVTNAGAVHHGTVGVAAVVVLAEVAAGVSECGAAREHHKQRVRQHGDQQRE